MHNRKSWRRLGSLWHHRTRDSRLQCGAFGCYCFSPLTHNRLHSKKITQIPRPCLLLVNTQLNYFINVACSNLEGGVHILKFPNYVKKYYRLPQQHLPKRVENSDFKSYGGGRWGTPCVYTFVQGTLTYTIFYAIMLFKIWNQAKL